MTISKVDKESKSLVHYNTRLGVSKLLELFNADRPCNLVRLLKTPSKNLSKKDVVQGFKAAELLLEKTLPTDKAYKYCMNLRSFVECYSSVLCDGSYISEIHGKKAAVISFIEGKAKKSLSPENCYEVGAETAKLHKITKKISMSRENNLSLVSWSELFGKVENNCSKIHKNLPKIINASLSEIKKNWPKKLPSGIIHADLFPDNIFFKNEKFTGIIDFYFSCHDFYSFEIAICLNALCFDGVKENLSFNVTKARKFIKGYSSVRKLENEEKKHLKVLAQGAAIRFLLTRVFDYLNLSKGALVTVKDPVEYLKRLEFHNSVKDFGDYCI